MTFLDASHQGRARASSLDNSACVGLSLASYHIPVLLNLLHRKNHPTMPVSSYSRDSTPYTASTTTATPPRFHPSQPTSPTISYAPTVTSLGQALRMNVVSRIAIEGKAKQGQDGASIKVYMKVSCLLRRCCYKCQCRIAFCTR